MTIPPDAKDWTWVLERPCPECGFDPGRFTRDVYGQVIRDNAARWPALLAVPGAAVRTEEDRWSTLEYACHVRDVFRIFAERLRLMRTEDSPQFANWDQDAAAVEGHYAEEDPGHAGEELVAAAETLAEGFESVGPQEWSRPGLRSNGSRFTVETLGMYLIHDPIHHLFDVAGVRSA